MRLGADAPLEDPARLNWIKTSRVDLVGQRREARLGWMDVVRISGEWDRLFHSDI